MINKIHERALRIAYKDDVSSFEDLLEIDKSVTVHQRNMRLLMYGGPSVSLCFHCPFPLVSTFKAGI